MMPGVEPVPFIEVAKRSQLSPREALVVTVGSYDVALFDVDGTVHAYENACPHQGGPIGEGYIEGATVTCPWHAWCFDLRTGKLTLGDFASLRRFEVRVEGDAVCVASEPSE